MNDKALDEVIHSHVNEVQAAYKAGEIENLRENINDVFETIEIEFPFGVRTCLRKKTQDSYFNVTKI